jgi:hypothetical protein
MLCVARAMRSKLPVRSIAVISMLRRCCRLLPRRALPLARPVPARLPVSFVPLRRLHPPAAVVMSAPLSSVEQVSRRAEASRPHTTEHDGANTRDDRRTDDRRAWKAKDTSESIFAVVVTIRLV